MVRWQQKDNAAALQCKFSSVVRWQQSGNTINSNASFPQWYVDTKMAIPVFLSGTLTAKWQYNNLAMPVFLSGTLTAKWQYNNLAMPVFLSGTLTAKRQCSSIATNRYWTATQVSLMATENQEHAMARRQNGTFSVTILKTGEVTLYRCARTWPDRVGRSHAWSSHLGMGGGHGSTTLTSLSPPQPALGSLDQPAHGKGDKIRLY